MSRTCRKHNVKGIATYGDCPQCLREMAAVRAAGSALDEQRRALAEARQRIIARCQQVEKWPRKDATDMIAANWDGIVEGLQQARRIIGAMWDELPVPLPQAVLEHNAKCAAAMGAQNAQMRDGEH